VSRRLRVSFTVTLLTAFATLFVALTAAVMLAYGQAGRRAALDTAETSLARAAETAEAATRALIRPVIVLAETVGAFAPLRGDFDPEGEEARALLTALGAEPAVQSVSLGFADGRLRQVLRLAGVQADMLPPPPPGATFALRDAGTRAEAWAFLDAQGRLLARAERPAPRPTHLHAQWYLLAEDDAVHVSTLYDMPLLGRPGLSVSRRLPPDLADGVLALDLTLDRLAGFLAARPASARSQSFVFNEDGILLAHQDAARAVLPLADGRSTWTTLNHAADPLLREIGMLYATGALAQGATRQVQGADGPLLVRLMVVGEMQSPPVMVAVVAPVADFTGGVDQAQRRGTLLAGIAFAAGLLLLALLAWRIARPLGALTAEAEAIRAFRLEEAPAVQSRITEIARLADAMQGMKSALGQFGVYVPRDLVSELMRRGEAARIGGERRRVTIMFSDVQGFTTLAEGLPPEELMVITSHYFQAVTAELEATHGTIDKYIGDAVMTIWNAPRDDASHALNACLAALRTRALTERLADAFAARGWPRLVTRFGVHTGEAVVGNVGSTDRMSWTAIGAMVNLAARLEGMNKLYGTAILVSEETRRAAGPLFVTRPVDLVRAKGATRPVEVHELIGLAVADGEEDRALRADPARVAALPAWGRMMAAWRAGDVPAARAALAECPDGDPVAALYAQRLAARREPADGDAWSPVVALETK
jgi:adenylate cyclase